MPERSETFIIRTKLHRPSTDGGLVCREALLARLEEGSRNPLSLICGPAGSGKSTLASQWLEHSEIANAWLSLGDEDGDLRTFVTYLVAAIRTVVPEACPETSAQLAHLDLSGAAELADYLCNDLNALREPLILVLDDYHRIHGPEVHDLLNRFLEYAPSRFHLLIVTRRDPPLPVATLRAHGNLAEIRLRDLRFTADETATVLEQTAGRPIGAEEARRLSDATDGWPVAVHLAALALRDRSEIGALEAVHQAGSQEIQDFLMAEVLSPLDAAFRDGLCRTSILDRLCAPLCGELIRSTRETDAGNPGPDTGDEFLEELRGSGLPFVALDGGGEWIRYHHLIQDLLQRQLRAKCQEGEVAAMHQVASAWFEEHGHLEEALRHALRSGDPDVAGQIVVRHRFHLTAGEQWVRLIGWLDLLPQATVDSTPELLVAYARTCDKRGRYGELARSLEGAEELIASSERGEDWRRSLLAEVWTMRAITSYHLGDVATALSLARWALEDLPVEAISERIYASMSYALSLQMDGRQKEAYRYIYAELQDEAASHPTGHGRLLQTLCFLAWIDADLPNLARTAESLLRLGREHGLQESIAFARIFHGAVLYQEDRFEDLEECLLPVAEDPHAQGFFIHVMAVQALALARQVRGDRDGAMALADELLAHILGSGGTSLLAHAQALQAELALLQGNVAKAMSIASEIETSDTPAGGYHTAIPELTVAKVLIRDGSATSLERAGQILEALEAFFEATHNRIHRIHVLALQSLVFEARRNEEAGTEAMMRAVRLAQPGGGIRLFVDLGPTVGPVLNRVETDEAGLHFIGRILAALREQAGNGKGPVDSSIPDPGNAPGEVDALSKREHEILTHLARNLSNKEIAAGLFISPGTVKRHTNSIYGKLSVHSRREAVAKAKGLGLLG